MSDSPASIAAGVSDACLGACLASAVLCLGGVDPMWPPYGWTLLLAAVMFRWLDVRSAWSAAILGAAPFLAWIALRARLSPTPWEADREVEMWIQAAGVFLVASSARRPWRSGWLVGVAAVATSLAAAWQLLLQPGWLPLGRVQVPQYFGRASGTFGNPNSLSAFALLLAGPLIGLAVDPMRDSIRRAMGAWGGAVALLAGALSLSRGVFLASAIVATFAIWRSGRRRVAVLVAATVVAASVLVPGLRSRWETAFLMRGETARAVIYPVTWEAAREKRMEGWGGGMFPVVFEAHRPPGFVDQPGRAHSEPLQIWLEHGLVGVSFAGLFVFSVWIRVSGGRIRRGLIETEPGQEPPEPRRSPVATGAACGSAILLLASAVDSHLRVPGVLLCGAWVAGAAVGTRRNARRAARRAQLLGSAHNRDPFRANASGTAERSPKPESPAASTAGLYAAAPGAREPGNPAPRELWSDVLALSEDGKSEWANRSLLFKFREFFANVRRRRILAAAFSSAVLLLYAPGAVRAARAELARRDAMRALTHALGESTQPRQAMASEFTAARERLRAVVHDTPHFAQAWADLSFAEMVAAGNDTSLRKAAGGAAVSAARAALGLSSAPAEYWVRLGDALQFEGRTDAAAAATTADDPAAAAYGEALRRAPRSPLVWYRYAVFLASRPGTARLAGVAIERCLQLDPTYRPAQDLQQRLSSHE